MVGVLWLNVPDLYKLAAYSSCLNIFIPYVNMMGDNTSLFNIELVFIAKGPIP